jgi:hypothetical protein
MGLLMAWIKDQSTQFSAAGDIHMIYNAQNDPNKHSYEDNAKFHPACSATALRYASRFRRNWGVMENFEYLSEFEDFLKCWLYCICIY